MKHSESIKNIALGLIAICIIAAAIVLKDAGVLWFLLIPALLF